MGTRNVGAEEERLSRLKVSPGGADAIVDEQERELVRNARDPQLERATDVLKGIKLFTERSPEVETPKVRSGKVAAAK